MRRPVTSQLLSAFAAIALAVGISQCAGAAQINNPPKYFPLVNTYFTSQTVSCPPTAIWAQVESFGGGGGGGGGSSVSIGGGGGAGAYTKCLFLCSNGPIVLVVGNAGAGGVGGGVCSDGTDGGTTTATQGSIQCGGGPGTHGVGAGCNPGAGGTAILAGPGSMVGSSNGSGGQAGGSGGAGGNLGNSGGAGGAIGLNGTPGRAGVEIITFF